MNVKLKKLGTSIDGITVWEVDGPAVRNDLDVEFSLGGNWMAKRYIPNREIWVEKTTKLDQCNTTGHEFTEARKMRYEGWPYDPAHNFASKEEEVRRKKGTCRVEEFL